MAENDKEKISRLIKNPLSQDFSDYMFLKEMVKKYPYFETAQLLLAKSSRLMGRPDAESQTKVAAVYSPDRAVLYRLINQMQVEASIPSPAAFQPVTVHEPMKEKPYDEKPQQPPLAPEEPAANIEKENLFIRKTFLYWLKKTQRGYFLNQNNAPIEDAPRIEQARKGPLPNADHEDGLKVHDLSIEKNEIDDQVALSASDHGEIVSETLAYLYRSQKLFDKAIHVYASLGLKMPGKKAYFATLIDEIRREAQKNP